MTSRLLITTADERTWCHERPVLFLGEWCRKFHRREAWRHLDAKVVPYHWDDRRQLERDYRYLVGVYEDLLLGLSRNLNDLHGCSLSVRYWRFLVGPWLGSFVQMVFDRWSMLERAVRDYDIDGVRVLRRKECGIVPSTMAQFNLIQVEDDWNESIFGHLLKRHRDVGIEYVDAVLVPASSDSSSQGASSFGMVPRIRKWTLAKLQMLSRSDDAFFLSTYMPIASDLNLQWRLGQVPQFWPAVPAPIVPVSVSMRDWEIDCHLDAGFLQTVGEMIPKHIPTLYLEGYQLLQRTVAGLNWPTRPRLIFTSNAFSADDVFKAWAARKVEDGAPLIIGQHGGNYGVARWSFMEEHQLAICDSFLSWGWKDELESKVRPGVNLKILDQHLKCDPEGDALLVEMTLPRYSYHMFSATVASQWLDYFNDQCRFVEQLSEPIRQRLLVRLYSSDYGWGEQGRWKERFPEIRLDPGIAPLAPLMEKSRINISTYNATTFLDSLGLNMPTIMFWNPKHWEIRDSAVPYFELLARVGIFHESPESAARHLTSIWDDVPAWWNSEPVQRACFTFCARYSQHAKNSIDILEKLLKDAMRP